MSEETSSEDQVSTPILAPFTGYVMTKDWIDVPGENRQVKSVAGTITIREQNELVGFKVKGSESNWVAMIEGNIQRVVILGCQIRAFAQSPIRFDSQTWVVD